LKIKNEKTVPFVPDAANGNNHQCTIQNNSYLPAQPGKRKISGYLKSLDLKND
jgi:hypothetical protein